MHPLLQGIIAADSFEALVIAGTGHRPWKLGGYSAAIHGRLEDLAAAAIASYQPAVVISGCAMGWDCALAAASAKLGIPWIAAVPFEGQENRWPSPSQQAYTELLATAAAIVVVPPGGYSGRAMQVRNEWMVDRCKVLLALWDGSTGGTGNCIDYANKTNRRIANLWASWSKYGGCK
jgi:uncharacterized phage-like protein YoqJ